MNPKKHDKTILVPTKIWLRNHPFGIACASDSYYSKLATRLTGVLRGLLGNDYAYTNLHLVDMAMTFAAYLEDKVSGTNVFNAFRAMYGEQFGGVMPFYDVDPETVYDDEPNPAEVRFLLWRAIDRIDPEKMINPTSDAIAAMAEEVCDILCDEFETAPECRELYDWLYVAVDYSDPGALRDRCQWIALNCYLTHVAYQKIEDVFESQLREIGHAASDLDPMSMMYQAEVCTAVSVKCGPLAMTPPEWLAKLLEMSGREGLPAERIRAADYRTYSRYKVAAINGTADDDNATFDLIDMAGRELTVSFNMLPREMRAQVVEEGCLDTSLFSDGNVWHINGAVRILPEKIDFDQAVEAYKETQRTASDRHAKILANNGGSPAGTAPDWETLGKILIRDPEELSAGMPSHIVNGKDYFFFINDDRNVDLIPGFACNVALEGNDLYDRAKATKESALPVTRPEYTRQMSDYLIEHSLLPDARLEDENVADDEAKAWFAANARFLSAICHTDRIIPHYA